MPAYVLGVDGGTTKTVALVADEQGTVLGAARGSGSNWTGPDVEIPMSVVVGTVREALAKAGLRGRDVAMASLGLAGADWPEDHARRRAYLEAAGIARRLVVKNDSLVGLRAGTRRPYGIGIVAGTGTNTAAIAPDGREYAFGYYASQGGAGDIAEDALWAVLRAEDGRGRPTRLTLAVLEKLGFAHPDDLLRAMVARSIERSLVNSLCPLVFEVAAAGDEVATEIVVRHGLMLAEYAVAAIRRFGMERDEFDIVLNGSVFKGQGPLLIDTIVQAVHKVAPRARIVRAGLEPAVGAVLLAYDALGITVSEVMYQRLAETSPGPEFYRTRDGSGLTPTRRS
ncbi:MAG: N-acetylglucosamine kinase [Anaerolineae bacterium]